MSSVLPLAASYIVASAERVLLSVGRTADENSSGAPSGARPANATQGAPFAALLPGDPAVVVVVDRVNDLAPAGATRPLSVALVANAAPALSAPPDMPIPSPASAAAAALLPPLAGDTVVAPSQAAYAYAQMMQVWLESRNPRSVAARLAPKAKPREPR